MGKDKFIKRYDRDDKDKGICFVNPYNFVSIRRERTEKHAKKTAEFNGDESKKEEKLYTGYLECRLKNKTPLAIPDAAARKSTKVKGHYQYPYFSVDGKTKTPVIPGSTIRGTIRSVYEAATDSCMVTVRDNMGISKRTEANDAFKQGLLMQEKDSNGNICWKLYQANRYVIPIIQYDKQKRGQYNINKSGNVRYIVKKGDKKDVNLGFRNGERVDIKYNNNKIISMKKSQIANAYVYIGETFGKKNGESVFEKCEEQVRKINSNKIFTTEEIKNAMAGMEETIKTYRNSSVNKEYEKTHFGYEDYEYAKEKGVIPLWYRVEGEKLYLSMAAIGRIQYQKTLTHLIGDMSPCKKRDKLCKACRLFGMTAGNEAMGSRVRFSDAVAVGKYEIEENVTLKELGAPRSSYLPFYSKDGKGYDEKEAEIRGRKFYWHNPKAEESKKSNSKEILESKSKAVYEAEYSYTQYEIDNKENKSNIDKQKVKEFERNATHDLVKPNAEFVFKVYYDGITRTQLEELAWILTLGENQGDSMRCHKIGHGKPLGLGSAKIIIKKNVMRTVGVNGYELKTTEINNKMVLFQDDDNALGEQKGFFDEKDEIIQQILKISNYHALCQNDDRNQENVSVDIRYPYIISKETKDDIKNCKLKGYNEYIPSKNDVASHKWFYKNRQEFEKQRRDIRNKKDISKKEKQEALENVVKKYTLPVLDKDSNLQNQKMPIYRLTVKQKQGGNSGNNKNNINNKNNKNNKNLW